MEAYFCLEVESYGVLRRLKIQRIFSCSFNHVKGVVNSITVLSSVAIFWWHFWFESYFV